MKGESAMWKVIPNTDDLYFANEQGQIKSKGRMVNNCLNGKSKPIFRDGRILKQVVNSYGYYCVTIKYLNGKQKVCPVHRLVAQTFIPNPDNKPQVNHIDGIKTNNHVNNLEWCTPSENLKHAFKNGLNKGGRPWLGISGEKHPVSIPVCVYDTNGNFIAEYESINLASKALGIKSSSHISSCLHGKRKTAGGYIWKLKNCSSSKT